MPNQTNNINIVEFTEASKSELRKESENSNQAFFKYSILSSYNIELLRLLCIIKEAFRKLVKKTNWYQINYTRRKRSEQPKIYSRKILDKVRETCNICSTTIFNLHMVCLKCGYTVSIDCFEESEKKDFWLNRMIQFSMQISWSIGKKKKELDIVLWFNL